MTLANSQAVLNLLDGPVGVDPAVYVNLDYFPHDAKEFGSLA